MIHNVYLIKANSGLCLFSRKYGGIEFNEDLIAGFLTALKDFATEVTGGEGIIKVLDMNAYNVCLAFREGLMISAAADKTDDRNLAMKAMGEVLNQFHEHYNLENWDGNIKMFEPFANIIDDILENGKIAEVEIHIPKLKKKLPKMILKMGTINKFEFDIANLCDGKKSSDDIAEVLGVQQDEVVLALEKLKKLKLID
ncbi:MAG: hypothetical protein EAX96_09665 [Candidatus Lokiarchaeota archaeon]|nr:hypothetical protein [Candidatus Lokiarchaeota archaeon]